MNREEAVKLAIKENVKIRPKGLRTYLPWYQWDYHVEREWEVEPQQVTLSLISFNEAFEKAYEQIPSHIPRSELDYFKNLLKQELGFKV